jgi:2'-hydroxyisoflavone reductase
MGPDEDAVAMTEGRPTLDLLVLGGTSWLGGEVAQQALARGHRVACLARGDSGEAPEGVTWVRADRELPTAYDGVAGRAWDAVLEVSWQPRFVRAALAALSPTAGHWVYVSSCSAYAEDSTPGESEDARVHEAYTGPEPVSGEDYGPAKVACEEACLTAMGAERVLVARAGLIGGYGDRSDRLGYWPARVARAGDGEPVLVPPRDQPAQVIDVADLASWLVDAAERRTAGVFNALGEVLTMGAVLEACVGAAGRAPRFVEASGEWLVEAGVEPWAGPESLPLWLPLPEYAGFMTRRNDAARAAGLTLRPVEDTAAASLRWERELGLHRSRRAGLSAGRETELLARLAAPRD